MLLSDVCLLSASGLSREQNDSGPLSRSKGQGHQAASLSAALMRKAAAVVSVGTYSACYVASAEWRATGRRGGAYCVAMCTACTLNTVSNCY